MVTATYPLIRNSRCGGYGWWIFQNTHGVQEPTDQQVIDDIASTDLTNPEKALYVLSDRYYGILDYGDPPLVPVPGQTGYESHRKLVAQQFVDWRTTPPAPLSYSVPTSVDMGHVYYNEYLVPPNSTVYMNGNNINYGTLTGRVVDQNGEGIAGALVSGYSESRWYGGKLQGFSRDTYTDANGYFEIRGYDPFPLAPADLNDLLEIRDKVILNMAIGAHACSNTSVGWAGGTFQPYDEFTLNSVRSEHERLVSNVSIPQGTSETYAAIRSLQATNVAVQGSADLKAGQDVRLLPSFQAAQGSEVHVHIEPLAMECTTVADGDLHMPLANTAPSMAGTDELIEKRELTVEFHVAGPAPTLNVFPSPTDGAATILLQGVVLPCQVVVLDATGQEVFNTQCVSASTILDLGRLATGEYTVMAYLSGSVLHRTIIKK